MTPELTVVMATYKQARFLRAAINSIIRQKMWPPSCLHVEAIAEDYPTRDVIGEYQGQSRGFSHATAHGPNLWVQRHQGICSVRTQYISFFDSDDVMLPGWLDRGLKVAQEISSRGKIPIVGPSYRMVDEKLFPIQDVILPEFSMERMMNGSIIPDFSITTTEALRSVGGYFDPDGYDPGHPYYSYSMWLRILKKYGDQVEVKLLPDIGFLYRQHRKSMHNRFQSKRHSTENVRKAREVARHYFPNWGMGMKQDGKTP